MKALKNLAVVFFAVSALFLSSCEEENFSPETELTQDIIDSISARVNDSLAYWDKLESGLVSWGNIHEFVESDIVDGKFNTIKGKRNLKNYLSKQTGLKSTPDTLSYIIPVLSHGDINKSTMMYFYIMYFHGDRADLHKCVNLERRYSGGETYIDRIEVGFDDMHMTIDSNSVHLEDDIRFTDFNIDAMNFGEYYMKSTVAGLDYYFVNTDSLGLEIRNNLEVMERFVLSDDNINKIVEYCHENELYEIHANITLGMPPSFLKYMSK
jgi:hypothetical protein